ncbi:MAG: hydroxymethylbilane synthase [Candidatus Eremiobacteraeota bacterium]|nr:hydroxymethylbilane synthase [Candidatus Eremiobacteraeota bacterium]
MAFPVTLRPRGRRALVVGGGPVALRKILALIEGGAAVRVVAPQVSHEVRVMVEREAGELLERAYSAEDLTGVFLAVAATDNVGVNETVLADAQARGILACDAMQPSRGDFTMQSVVRVGSVTFTIDTGGSAPAFAKRLARELRERFGESYGTAAKTLARMRVYVKAVLPLEERAGVLRALAELPIEALATMNPAQAEHEVEETIQRLRGIRTEHTTQSSVCASRASALAMIQARAVAANLARHGIATTILNVTTTGDRVQDRSLAAIGSDSLFVKELELALRDGRADYAVHSAKDLPSALPDDMQIVAISQRADPRDAFCSERFETFESLPADARVGTSSLRRRAQLAALRDDLTYVDIRGNVDTRLRKLRDGDYDAIVLAAAGLERLHASARHTVPFPVEHVVPAVGQGALAVETRANASTLADRLRAAINDSTSELAVACERAALHRLQGGCQAPIGIHARFAGERLTVHGSIAALDGSRVVRGERSAIVTDVAAARELGIALANVLRDGGGLDILAMNPRAAPLPLAGKLIVLGRTQDRPGRIADALRADGAEVIEVRSGDAAPSRVPDVLVFPSSGSVDAASAVLAELHRAGTRPTVAAMGPQSSAAATAAGFAPDLVAPEAGIDALLGIIRSHLLESNTA